MPLRRPKIDWRPILLEASFVVLGVVLALTANEWRKGFVDQRNARLALESIREELRANRAAVHQSLGYHLQLTDTLDVLIRHAAAANPSSAQPDARLFARGFFHPASLLHTAWDAAGATDAVRHMNYSDVLRMARIYEDQDRYRRQSEQVGQLIYSALFSGGYDGVLRNYANLNTILAAFWYRECQLLKQYGDVLRHLGDQEPADGLAIPSRCSIAAA